MKTNRQARIINTVKNSTPLEISIALEDVEEFLWVCCIELMTIY